jgi:hypothetical protein
MDTVLLGFKRHMVPIPTPLFRHGLRLASRKAARVLGGLDDESRQVHHIVVRDQPPLAAPMAPEHISSALGLPLARVVAILDDLERRLIFLFRPGGRDVEWAYPVTVADTPHHVVFSTGERLNAA